MSDDRRNQAWREKGAQQPLADASEVMAVGRSAIHVLGIMYGRRILLWYILLRQ